MNGFMKFNADWMSPVLYCLGCSAMVQVVWPTVYHVTWETVITISTVSFATNVTMWYLDHRKRKMLSVVKPTVKNPYSDPYQD